MKKYIAPILILVIMATFTLGSFADMYSPYRNKYIEGYLKQVDKTKIIIEEYDGTLHILNTLKNAQYSIDGTSVGPGDFKPGMEVYGELKGRSISYLEGFSTENLGYIDPQSKVRNGLIKSIDRNQITIMQSNNEEATYFTSPATIALKKGRNVPLSTLYTGDRVKIYFDEIDTSIISKIEIEGDSVIVQKIYRGKLGRYDEMEDYIVLNSVDIYKNSTWQDDKDTTKLYVNEETPIYMGGQKVPYGNIKYFKDKTVYMAVKDSFGEEKIERLVIKDRFETTYSSKIDEINWYSESMELSNNQNIAFNDGTIFIKNDRLVDKYSINPNSDAFVVADGRNDDLMADLVYVYNEDVNNSNIGQNYIYVGRLDEIVKGSVKVEDFYLLDENEWESFSDDKEFYYDEDTYVYDAENEKHITTEEFYAKHYAVEEDSSYVKKHKLRDWHGYIYADGDRIAAIRVEEDLDSLLKQRITTGIVEIEPNDDSMIGYNLTIMNARDWSNRHDKWMAKSGSLRLAIENALIIKGDKAINYEEIKAGDRLYLLRDDFNTKVIIVK